MNPDDIVQCEECGTEIRIEDCYTLVDGQDLLIFCEDCYKEIFEDDEVE